MIKNEFIKFFTPLKISIYGGIILIFILLNDVLFADKASAIVTFHTLLYNDISSLIFMLPIILSPIVSDMITRDYECGCMKFFIIYKSKSKVLLCKIISLILITGIMIIFTFTILNVIYIFKDSVQIDIFLDIKMGLLFLTALMPVLLIYVLISILTKNSTIISLLVFLLIVMSDFIPKTIGNITPRRFLWECLLKNQIDKFSIILFSIYTIVLVFLNFKLFNKKELIH
ncbi:ABC transporter permease [Clostridium ljungdahlii]|uniref:ABC-2 family transporter protein n=1 Tax=Clostridium ljungdahlii TaxID=1538 RepID=A0A162KNV9_9CLOT|nr:ABC transporter permease [Clostridium ljungdahlii]OAA84852.1 ABC-2 family transporter protein [Clostridium ljungdahlii]